MERSVYPSDTREPASTLTKKPSAIVENEGTQPKKGVTAEQSESNAESASEQMWEARAQRAGN